MLTKGLDNFLGQAGNDTIIGSVSKDAELNTFSVLDNIDGGAGKDTLKVSSEGYIAPVAAVPGPPAVAAVAESGKIVIGANVKNVEIVEASSAGALNVDTTGSAGVTTLNVTGANGAVTASAAATTDVNVELTAKAAGTIDVKAGNNVTVKVADVQGNVVVGETGKPVAGTVTVETTGKAFANAANLGAINTFGGTTVSVTQKASADASAAASATTAKTVTQGAVTVTGEGKTTEVTVKQDAAVFQKAAVVAVEGVAVQQSVKFSALAKDGTVAIGGLTFKAAKDLTAAEVAQGFANIAKGVVSIAGGNDTQASGVHTNGTYIGSFNPAWTSAAASGDTVVFSGPKTTDATLGTPTVAGKVSTGGTVDATATAATVVEGKTVTPGVTGALGVTNGLVTIADKATAESIKTITVDGFGAVNTTNTKVLETLNLSNGGVTYNVSGDAVAATVSVADAAKTLALNLEKVGFAATPLTATSAAKTAVAATVTIGGTQVETLNVKSTGANQANLSAANAKALNVTGTGLLNAAASTLTNVETITVKESAGLNLGASVAASTSKLTSVDASATSGNVTMSIDAAKATYLGGTGVDTVTVSTATSAAPVSKAITLGAGDDKLDLSAITAANQIAAGAKFDGGEGTDTLKLSVEAAANDQLSANGTFEKQATAFEKLELTTLAGTAVKTVNLDNLNDVSYVISGNTTGVAAGKALVAAPTGTFAAGTNATNATTKVTFSDITVPASADGLAPGTATVTVNGMAITFSTLDQTVGGQLIPAAEVAAAFAGAASGTSATNPAVAFTAPSGTAGVWTKGTVTGVDLPFTAPFGTATAVTVSGTGATPAAVTPGAAATAATFTAVTMPALEAGQSVTIAGKTVTAVAAADATDVAAVFAGTATAAQGLKFDAASITSSMTGWSASAAGAVLSMTAAAPGTGAVAPVTAGSAATDATATLSLTNMLNNGTLELTATGNGANVVMKDASGTSDAFNIITNAGTNATDVAMGTVKVAKVETINISATKTFNVVENGAVVAKATSNTLTLDADAAKSIMVGGAGALKLTLAADTLKVVTSIDASTNTGGLTASAQGATNAVTITGGAGADTLTASTGATAKADVLVGGAGNDVLYAGSNGAKLTGGEGNDVFVLSAVTGTGVAGATGSKEVNTYSSITDFQAGDLLQLAGLSGTNQFAKLTATLNENTSVFSNFADAAILQAKVGEAVWFQFKGNAYVVVDQAGSVTTAQAVGTEGGTSFENGYDTVIELVGVDLANASFNTVTGTVALV